MGILIFNGTKSASFHAFISEPPGYVMPEREIENIHIPGRNGDLIIDSGHYKNVEISYKMVMDASSESVNYAELASGIATWLHPLTNDYCILRDTYNPYHYRKAKFKGGDSISNIFNKAGEFDLKFDCCPQRFLESGASAAQPSSETSEYIIYINPTNQIALPRITVNASAKNAVFDIKNSAYNYFIRMIIGDLGVTIIDSEKEDCRASDGISDRNGIISFYKDINHSKRTYEFPKLYPGTNRVEISRLSSIEIIPNWWEL